MRVNETKVVKKLVNLVQGQGEERGNGCLGGGGGVVTVLLYKHT